MDQLKQQVSRARRRLVFQQFLSIITWSLFGALLVALIGVAIPKIWVINVDSQVWLYSWLGGALAMGLFIAIAITACVRRTAMDAAMEIDRRFGLKERVASGLMLTEAERETEAGRALLEDALRRVNKIDVGERFGISLNWRTLLPLAPAVMVFALMFVGDADPTTQNRASAKQSNETKQVKTSAQELKKRLEAKRKEAEEKGLKDATDLFKKFEKAIEDMAKKSDVDRKKALIKLNDLAKEIENRRKALGGADQMREQLKGLKDLNQGPADQLAKAIKNGNFNKAMDELKKLAEKVEKGNLTDAEKEQFEKQMEQLQQKLQQMVDAHKQMKEELKEQIRQAEKQGDLAKAGELQQQLDKLNQQNSQMDRLQQMANQLGACKECVQNGDSKGASQQMAQLAEQLDALQKEMSELDTLSEALDQISMSKNSMNCKECGGEGCEFCQGMMGGMNSFGQFGMGMGNGMGEGPGEGYRPEEETDTSSYDSKVAGKIQRGEAVVTGDAAGPNKPGVAREAEQAPLTLTLPADADPLAEKRLPRWQRDHAKQYFDLLRERE